ncbi:hypothetical protein EDB86DRAFT_2826481 [Lactarius hatsudake]|nr:hypothetical protein EDB86DRAFT_2826481 [Lactarius hatsudake]
MGNYIQAESIGVQLVITIGAFLCETFFFGAAMFLTHSAWLSQRLGAYSTVFLYSSVLMLKRPTAPARNYMLAVSAFMYAVSAAHWAMNMAVITRILRVGIDFMSPFERLVVVYLPTINMLIAEKYILSDGIVVWRALGVVGSESQIHRIHSSALLPRVHIRRRIHLSVLSAAGAAYLYIGIEYESERDSAMSRYLVWTIWGLSVGTNIWATGLIYIQIWQHRQFIRSLLGKGTATSTAEKVLIFMVESGALYLCIWGGSWRADATWHHTIGGLCTTVLQSEGDVDRTEEDPGHWYRPSFVFLLRALRNLLE